MRGWAFPFPQPLVATLQSRLQWEADGWESAVTQLEASKADRPLTV
jgi:hypothetical protein